MTGALPGFGKYQSKRRQTYYTVANVPMTDLR